jgi:hypothetical protein
MKMSSIPNDAQPVREIDDQLLETGFFAAPVLPI